MTSNVKVCLDLQNLGECTKGLDCPVCNDKLIDKIQDLNINELSLNTKAKGYVPKSKRVETNQNTQNTQKSEDIQNLEKKETSSDNKLNFNLQAQEYKPKFTMNTDTKINNKNENNFLFSQDQDEEQDDNFQDEDEAEEFDMIMKDIIDNEALENIEDHEESDDEDKWFPKYKDCECCKGFVYKCKGIACENMDACYCKVKDECDMEDAY